MIDSNPFKTRDIFTFTKKDDKLASVTFHASEIYLACKDFGFRFLGDNEWVKIENGLYQKVDIKYIECFFNHEFHSHLSLHYGSFFSDAVVNILMGKPIIKKNLALMEILKPLEPEMSIQYFKDKNKVGLSH